VFKGFIVDSFIVNPEAALCVSHFRNLAGKAAWLLRRHASP